MEEDRLDQLRFLAEQYHAIMEEQRPKLVSSCTRLDEPVRRIEVSRDMDVVRKKVKSLVFLFFVRFHEFFILLGGNRRKLPW